MKKIVLMAAVTGLGLTVAVSCSKKEGETSASVAGGGGGAGGAAGVVKRIEMPRYQSDLPDAEGREAFATSCLSCHSTAYIGMQPPLTAAKWEEEVRKMQKTYGAPIADEQVKPIVSYLMAVKEASGGAHIREAQVAAPAANALVKPARDPGDRADDAKRGEDVFAQLCASCHGTDGRGTGPAGLALLPKPADLTAGKLSDEGVARAVCNGVPGTAMAVFGTMPQKDLRAVEAYVLDLCTDDVPAGPQSEEGRQLYLQNCASCHGADGRGDGIAGVLLPRAAADFHLRRPTAAYAKQVIADGVAGTSMPGWKAKLNEQQRGVLAEYVRGFFKEGK
jgi:cbb3-type cytochrome c oxidase subunit III